MMPLTGSLMLVCICIDVGDPAYQIMFVLFSSNITDVNIGAGTASSFRASAFTPTFLGCGVRFAQSLVFCVAFCR